MANGNDKVSRKKRHEKQLLLEPSVEEEISAILHCRKLPNYTTSPKKGKQSSLDKNGGNMFDNYFSKTRAPSMSAIPEIDRKWQFNTKGDDSYTVIGAKSHEQVKGGSRQKHDQKGNRVSPLSNGFHRAKLSSLLSVLFGCQVVLILLASPSCLASLAPATSRANLNSLSWTSNVTQGPQNERPSSSQVSMSTRLSAAPVLGPSQNISTTSAASTSPITTLSSTTMTMAPTMPMTATTAASVSLSTSGEGQSAPMSLPEVETSPSSDESTDSEETEASSGGEESTASNQAEPSKLATWIRETAGEAADGLVSRMRSNPSESPSERDTETSGQPETDGDELESTEASATPSSQSGAEAKRSQFAKLATSGPTSGAGEAGKGFNSSSKAEDEEHLKSALETYARWVGSGNDIIELVSRKLLPVLMEYGYEVDGSTVTGLVQWFNGIRGLKPWALKLLDASAKLSSGVLAGTQSDFGDFDQCLGVRIDNPAGLPADGVPEELDEITGLPRSTIIGRYCLADLEFPKPPRRRLEERNVELQTDWAPIELRRPLYNFSESAAFKDTIFVETANFFHMLYVDPMRVGICITNKIDPNALEQVMNKMFQDFQVTVKFHNRCVTKFDKPSWTKYQKASAWIWVVACFLVVFSTLLDVLHLKLHKLPLPGRVLNDRKSRLQQLLLRYRPVFTSFSLLRNTKRLFKSQSSTSRNGVKQNPATSWSSAVSSSSSASSGCASSTGGSPELPNGKRYRRNLLESSGVTGNGQSTNLSPASSSLESSPSIERRSSITSSARHLISSDIQLDGSELMEQQKLTNRGQISTVNSILEQGKLGSSIGRLEMASRVTNSKVLESNVVDLGCLHGIRVITMAWMVVNHTYLFGGFFVIWAHRRLIDIAEWPKSISFQLVLNGWLTVETYFFLSAMIIVLGVLPLMKASKFAYLPFIFHRLVRLVPAYVGLVTLNFLWPLVSSGPLWMVKGPKFIREPCENYLWTNFLFINNWIWPEKQCMVHTWFLSADFQLYLLAPIVVYLLYRRPVLGHSVNIMIAIVASIVSGFVIYANKLMPSTLINKLEFDSIKQQLSYSYFATYQHMGPYCLGIFIGYLLHKRPHISLPKHLTWLMWLLLPPLSFTTLLLTYLWNGAYEEPGMINPSPLVSGFYVAIHRTIWTSLVAWIVFACSTGRAKLLSSFLSHSMFIPLSRLSFSIYLVHFPVIMFRTLNLRQTVEWSDSNILWNACGNFIVSCLVAYVLNITFESPLINLERALFGRARASRDQKYTLEESFDKHCGSVMQSTRFEQSKIQPSSPVQASVFRQHRKRDIGRAEERDSSTGATSQSNHSGDIRGTGKLPVGPSSILSLPGGQSFEQRPRQARKVYTTTTGGNELSNRSSSDLQWPAAEQTDTFSLNSISGDEGDAEASNENNSSFNVDSLTGEEHTLKMDYPSNGLSSARGRRWSQMTTGRQQVASRRGLQRRYSVCDAAELIGSTTAQQRHQLKPLSEYRIQVGGYKAPASNLSYLVREQSLGNPQRPTQYATLARTSRFNHQINDTASNGYLQQATKHLYRRSRDQQQQYLEQSNQSSKYFALGLQNEPQLMDQRLSSQRPRRYNTLGSGRERGLARDWQDLDRRFENFVGAPERAALGASKSWLQPGALLPRIDSATLRGQNHSRHIDQRRGSIAEETEESTPVNQASEEDQLDPQVSRPQMDPKDQ